MSHLGNEPVDPAAQEPLDPETESDLDGALGSGDGDDRDHSDGDDGPGGHAGERRGRGVGGCLIVLVVLALVVGGLWFGVTRGIDYLKDQFSDPEDYSGTGSGQVLVEIKQGDSATDMGQRLEKADVVASVEAFTNEASSRDQEFQTIQVGFYEMGKKMSAQAALDRLLDESSRVESSITIPEGLRVADMIDLLVEKTDFKKKARWEKAARDFDALGLPNWVKANPQGMPEGYFFPATYPVRPGATPADILKAMVDRWRQAADDADLEAAAKRVGKTPAELMTIASLIEAEGRGDDMPKVSRVIYNRLDGPGDKAGTNGLLQIDAAVNYAHNRKLGVGLSSDDLQIDSPYNTYQNQGLPPTPIEAPGDDAIDAAAHPAKGDWYYYVTVNLKTGETKFYGNYDGFLKGKAEFKSYCTTSDAC